MGLLYFTLQFFIFWHCSPWRTVASSGFRSSSRELLFLRDGVVNPTSNPQLGGSGFPFFFLDGRGMYHVWWRVQVYRVLMGKPEGKRPLGRPRRRWEDNINIDLQEMGCESMEWIDMAQDRDRWRALVNAVMNLRVP